MMQVGIFTGYFPYTLEDTARKIRALDFNTVQLDLRFLRALRLLRIIKLTRYSGSMTLLFGRELAL